MSAYYSEHDPFAAAWLRELIKDGLIAPGFVDERSIVDVKPEDLVGYDQWHFFAGVAGWSLALRAAGVPDDFKICTASLPCQPWSSAGAGRGAEDERHLAPVFLRLVEACRFPVILGEQVASAAVIGRSGGKTVEGDGQAWLDALFDGLEASRYACGAVAFPACGVGAPHIRLRLYWGAERLADAGKERLVEHSEPISESDAWGTSPRRADSGGCSGLGRMADAADYGLQGRQREDRKSVARGVGQGGVYPVRAGETHGVGDAIGARLEGFSGHGDRGDEPGRFGTIEAGSTPEASGAGRVAESEYAERWTLCFDREDGHHGADIGRQEAHGESGACGEVRGMADATGEQCGAGSLGAARDEPGTVVGPSRLRSSLWLADALLAGRAEGRAVAGGGPAAGGGESGGVGHAHDAGPQGRERVPECPSELPAGAASLDCWGDTRAIGCRDAKTRRIPTEPALFPLANGIPNRVGLLRGAGNAIVPQVAAEFIAAFLDSLTEL